MGKDAEVQNVGLSELAEKLGGLLAKPAAVTLPSSETSLEAPETPAVQEEETVEMSAAPGAPAVSAAAVEAPVVAEDAVVQAPVVETPLEIPAPIMPMPPAEVTQAAETVAPTEVSEISTPVVETPAEMVSKPEGEHPALAEPAGMFADGVARVRAIAAAAGEEVGKLKERLEKEAAGYRGEEWQETQAEAFPGEKSAEDVRADRAALDEFKKRFPNADVAEIENGVELQEQYKLGRELAADAMKIYERKLGGVVKELAPGMFGKEAALQTEMGGLQKFFGGLSELDEQRMAVEAWDRKKQDRDFMDFADSKKLKAKDKEVDAMRPRVAGHQSLEGLLKMGNMPTELRSVIEAAQGGKDYDFGEGPIGDFRKKIYTDVLGSLGLKLGSGAAARPMEPAAAIPTAVSMQENAGVPLEETVEETPGEMADKMRGLADKMVEASKLADKMEMRTQLAAAVAGVVSEMGAMFTGADRGKMRGAWDMLHDRQRENILGALRYQAKNRMRGVSGKDVEKAIKEEDRSAGVGASGLLVEIISMLIDKPVSAVIAELQEQTK